MASSSLERKPSTGGKALSSSSGGAGPRFNLFRSTAKLAYFRCAEDPLLLVQIQLGDGLRFEAQQQQGQVGAASSSPATESTSTPTTLIEEIVFMPPVDPDEEDDPEDLRNPILLACLSGQSGAKAIGGKGTALLPPRRPTAPKAASSPGPGTLDQQQQSSNEEVVVAEFYYSHEADPTDDMERGMDGEGDGEDLDEDEDDGGWYYFGSIFKTNGRQVLRCLPVPLSGLVRASSKGRMTCLSGADVVNALGSQYGLTLSCHFSSHEVEKTAGE
jgi:hypothetical protein